MYLPPDKLNRVNATLARKRKPRTVQAPAGPGQLLLMGQALQRMRVNRGV